MKAKTPSTANEIDNNKVDELAGTIFQVIETKYPE